LVYVSPTPVETTKQSAELGDDSSPLKIYVRRPQITSELVREPSTQLKDASNDTPNYAPNDVSNYVPISAPSEAYDLHANKKPIGCKWMFSVKMNPDGSIARLKAHLVAKGYAQTYGIDYSKTRVVGKLNHLTITRPDIAFPVSVVSQFLTAPRMLHWDVVTQILRYVKGTLGLGILYANHGYHIAEGFTDVDYVGCPNTSRSTTGYYVFVGGNLVS
nr:uncharacterized protein [Tanacetum cinerariifolium]